MAAPYIASHSDLIQACYREVGIDPRNIDYIEAQGMGSPVADMAEWGACNQALKALAKEQGVVLEPGRCRVSTLKPMAGHMNSASALGALFKIICSLQTNTLHKILDFTEINPHLDTVNQPCGLAVRTEEWPKRNTLRLAGLHSYGASGNNAHVVIEEYLDESKVEGPKSKGTVDRPALIVLSAKNEDRLRVYAQNLLDYVHLRPLTPRLEDVAYTLQVGRQAMEERWSFLVKSVHELTEKLEAYVKAPAEMDGFWRGVVKTDPNGMTPLQEGEDSQESIDRWVIKGELEKLAELWSQGFVIDWNKLYGDTKPRRIRLPAYPFANERYWIQGNEDCGLRIAETGKELHPLVHENTSDVSELRFSSTFTGQESFFAVMQGQKVLLAAAYLELARVALERAVGVGSLEEGPTGMQIKNVTWADPIALNGQAKKINIGLFVQEDRPIQYEIYSEAEAPEKEPVVHGRGVGMPYLPNETATLDIPEMLGKINHYRYGAEQYYKDFKTMGSVYGSEHRGLETVYVGDQEVLAKLSLPASVLETQDPYILHPALIDAVFQACMGLMMEPGDPALLKPFFPFAMDKIEITGKCSASMWGWIRAPESSIEPVKQAIDRDDATGRTVSEGESARWLGFHKFDIDLCDDKGQVCVRMKGVDIRAYRDPVERATPEAICEVPSLEEDAGQVRRVGKVSGQRRQPGMRGLSIEECVTWDLKELLKNFLKVPSDKLDVDTHLTDFGFDSVSLVKFAKLLTEHYGHDITPSLFFGHSTIEQLTHYFLTEHLEAVQGFYHEDAGTENVPVRVTAEDRPTERITRSGRFRFLPHDTNLGGDGTDCDYWHERYVSEVA